MIGFKLRAFFRIWSFLCLASCGAKTVGSSTSGAWQPDAGACGRDASPCPPDVSASPVDDAAVCQEGDSRCGIPWDAQGLLRFPEMCDSALPGPYKELVPNPPGCPGEPCGQECDICEGVVGACSRDFEHYRCSADPHYEDHRGSQCIATAN